MYEYFLDGNSESNALLILGECTCLDHLKFNISTGRGNCEEWQSKRISGNAEPFCYVSPTSPCTDQTDSTDVPGYKYSAQACKNGR